MHFTPAKVSTSYPGFYYVLCIRVGGSGCYHALVWRSEGNPGDSFLLSPCQTQGIKPGRWTLGSAFPKADSAHCSTDISSFLGGGGVLCVLCCVVLCCFRGRVSPCASDYLGTHCVDQPVLNSQRFSCLCLLSAGIKGVQLQLAILSF